MLTKYITNSSYFAYSLTLIQYYSNVCYILMRETDVKSKFLKNVKITQIEYYNIYV